MESKQKQSAAIQHSTVTKDKEDKIEEHQEFTCSKCNLKEKVHYKGTTPPFARQITLKYPSYVMKDPFSPSGKGEILILGSDCSDCEEAVCISKECSIFYLKTYCINCALKQIDNFPAEIRLKIRSVNKS